MTRLPRYQLDYNVPCSGRFRLPDIELYLGHGSVALTSMTGCSELSSSTYYYLDVCSLYSLRVAHERFEEPLLPLLSRHRLR